MKLTTKILTLLPLILLHQSKAVLPAGSLTGNGPSVFYYPLLMNSNEGMSRSQIRDCYDLTSVLKRELPEILRLIRQPELKTDRFYETEVRLLVVTSDGHRIYMDLGGDVDEDGTLHAIKRTTQLQIRKIILDALPKS